MSDAFTYEKLAASLLGGTAEVYGNARVHVHMTEPVPPVSRLQQFRDAIAAGYDVIPEEDHVTVRVVHESWEIVYMSRRAWRAARRALTETT